MIFDGPGEEILTREENIFLHCPIKKPGRFYFEKRPGSFKIQDNCDALLVTHTPSHAQTARRQTQFNQ